MTRKQQLDDLVAAQTRDAATDRVCSRACQESQIETEGAAGFFALVADPRAVPADAALIAEETYTGASLPQLAPPFRLVGVSRIWSIDVIRYKPPARCPVCLGRALPRLAICACCHATATDPTPHPMQESAKAASRRARLAGGTGGTPLKRGRKALWSDYQPVGAV